MPRRPKRASIAQARLLLHLWLNGRATPHIPGTNPTWDAVIRAGWLRDTGVPYQYPSGARGTLYLPTIPGIRAAAAAVLGAYPIPADVEP